MRLSFPTLGGALLLPSGFAFASPTNHVGLSEVYAGGKYHGAVASEVDVCSRVGGDELKKGGNAVDSMIATVLCVGVINAYHSGIGGGGFALIRGGPGDYAMIDFRECAPAGSNETMYSNNTDPTASTIGGLSVGIPGELRGLEAMHKRYGSRPWLELFKPAIKLARDGFIVPGQLAGAIASAPYVLTDPTFAAVYAPNGTVLTLGAKAYRPTYAKTLETIAAHGANAFYTGAIANASVRAAQARRGIITLKDLAAYKAIWRTPRSIKYGKNKAWSTVAPSSGVVALSALNILGGYNLSYANDGSDSNITAHRLVEALKFAYGQRTVLGDPAFTTNVSSLEGQFLTSRVGKVIRTRLSDNSTGPPSLYDPTGYEIKETPGTSQITVADGHGMVVSLTTTVNLYFGSQIMVPETGVVLNDEMDDFSSPGSSNTFGYIATPINFIRPGKRPLSSISPVIVEDSQGRFIFATGAAGGSRIITANVQNVHHVLDQGWSAQKAINAPRLHDQIFPQTTTFEYSSSTQDVVGYNNGTVAYLRALGHNITFVAPGVSVSASIRYKDGKFDAAADPRVAGSGSVVV